MEGAIRVCDVQFSFLMLNWIATLKSRQDKHKHISGTGACETYSSLRALLLRLLLKSGTAFYIMSRTTFKSGTAIAVSAE